MYLTWFKFCFALNSLFIAISNNRDCFERWSIVSLTLYCSRILLTSTDSTNISTRDFTIHTNFLVSARFFLSVQIFFSLRFYWHNLDFLWMPKLHVRLMIEETACVSDSGVYEIWISICVFHRFVIDRDSEAYKNSQIVNLRYIQITLLFFLL